MRTIQPHNPSFRNSDTNRLFADPFLTMPIDPALQILRMVCGPASLGHKAQSTSLLELLHRTDARPNVLHSLLDGYQHYPFRYRYLDHAA